MADSRIPLYLITGFLDSGKTTLLTDTLNMDYFNDGQRAVLVRCEDGEVEYDVKAGAQTDTRVRLKGKGVPSLRNKSTRGDHYVTLVVQVPTDLSKDAKEALRTYDDIVNGKNPEKPGKGKKGFFDKMKEALDE